jgi:hypothetical protein
LYEIFTKLHKRLSSQNQPSHNILAILSYGEKTTTTKTKSEEEFHPLNKANQVSVTCGCFCDVKHTQHIKVPNKQHTLFSTNSSLCY